MQPVSPCRVRQLWWPDGPGQVFFSVGLVKSLSSLPDRASKNFEVLHWHLTSEQYWATWGGYFDNFAIYLQEYSIIKPYQRDQTPQNNWMNKLWSNFQPETAPSRSLPPSWHDQGDITKTDYCDNELYSLPSSLQLSMLIAFKCIWLDNRCETKRWDWGWEYPAVLIQTQGNYLLLFKGYEPAKSN